MQDNNNNKYNLLIWPVLNHLNLVSLTNRIRFAVRLFSNKSQMTSKCGKNKKVAHDAIAECVTDILTTS